MNKKAAIAITLASAILSVTPAFAIDSSTSARTNIIKSAIANPAERQLMIASREAIIREKLSTQKLVIEKRKMDIASKEATLKQKIDQVRVKIASREAEVKLKLMKFKDQQKAEIAERINTTLNKINKNHTDHMLRNLDLMSTLLNKLVGENADTSALIEEARTAVQAQAQKDYTITVTTETKIRLEAQAKRDLLFKDLAVVRKLVIEAKQSVANAVRITKSEGKVKEATVSGQ